ncbi:MAG: PAS domain-containing protein, partial [Caldimonas sp.]
MSAASAQSIIDAAPVLIWSAALDRSEAWLSASWSTYSGLAPAELENDGWTRAVHPEDLGRCLGIRSASFDARTAFSLDLRLRRADGSYGWML